MHSLYREALLRHLIGVCKWILNILPLIGLRNRQNPPRGILSSDVLAHSPSPRVCRPVGLNSQWPAQPDHKTSCGKFQESRSRGHRWYCALIIWYVMKECDKVFLDDEIREQLWKTIEVFQAMKNDQNDDALLRHEELHLCFLRWYHSHSFIQICGQLEAKDPPRFSQLHIDLDKHKKWAESWQVQAEKFLRLFGQGRLVDHALDQEVAHLAFLADEISISKIPLTQHGRSCLSYAKDLIQKRKETTTLSPGRSLILRWDASHDMRSAMPRPAPWELSCLAHQVALSFHGLSPNPEECMKDCKAFLLSDYTFMTTWDQSKTDAIGHWWDVGTSSIISATILDHWQWKDSSWPTTMVNENDFETKVESSSTLEDGQVLQRSSFINSFRRRQAPKPVQSGEARSVEDQQDDTRKILELLREKTKPKEESEGFVWVKRHPQALYHADTTVQSLEDTPQVYNLKQTKDVKIRSNLEKYFEENGIASSPDWSLGNISTAIPPQELLHMSCFDLALKVDGNETPEIGILSGKGRIEKNFWQITTNTQPEIMDLIEGQKDSSLWLLYFLGKPERHPKFPKFTKRFKDLLGDNALRKLLIDIYQESLFSVLNDSVSVILTSKMKLTLFRWLILAPSTESCKNE